MDLDTLEHILHDLQRRTSIMRQWLPSPRAMIVGLALTCVWGWLLYTFAHFEVWAILVSIPVGWLLGCGLVGAVNYFCWRDV